MKFSELIKSHYKIFARMKDEERSRNIGVVKYVETLSSMAGVNISDWDVKAVFGKGEGNKLIDDKNEINRRFFAEVERLAANSTSTDGDVFTEELKTQLRAAEMRHVTTLMAKEQQNADARLRDALHWYREYETGLKRAAEHLAAVRRLSGTTSNIEEQVRTVDSGNFWQFVGVENGTKVSFVTRADISLTYKNPAAGIDISINFGRFKAVFSLEDFTLKVFGFERNISCAGYPHPHIQGASGGICWGTAANTATRALASCSFVEPMMLLATILTSYNPGSPYRSMEEFQRVVGTPEEAMAREALNAQRDDVRAVMAPLDQMQLNVDLRRPTADAAALANATAGVATQTRVQRATTAAVAPANIANNSEEIAF